MDPLTITPKDAQIVLDLIHLHGAAKRVCYRVNRSGMSKIDIEIMTDLDAALVWVDTHGGVRRLKEYLELWTR